MNLEMSKSWPIQSFYKYHHLAIRIYGKCSFLGSILKFTLKPDPNLFTTKYKLGKEETTPH